MNKKQFVLLPDYATDIILSILENFNLKEKEEKAYQELRDSPDGQDRSFLYKEIPSLNVAKIAREIKTNETSEEDAVLFLSQRMSLSQDKAKEMLEEIKNKIVAFSQVIEQETQESVTAPVVQEKKPSFSEEFSKKASQEKRGPDSYRETITEE